LEITNKIRRYKMNRATLVSLVTFLIISMANLCNAEVPKLINYQGHLTDKGGNPLTGTFSITFTIYDSETDGTALWTETQGTVAVNNGLFNILLGTATVGGIPESVFDGADRWLGVAVESDSETSPRQQLVSVPYAYKCNECTNAANVSWNGIADMPSGFADGVDDIGSESGNVVGGGNDGADGWWICSAWGSAYCPNEGSSAQCLSGTRRVSGLFNIGISAPNMQYIICVE